MLRIALLCFAGAAIAIWALFAVNGCVARPNYDRNALLVQFTGGTVGESNDPIKFPKPLNVLRIEYRLLRPGYFAVRHDSYLLGDRFVLHRLVRQMPDGSWEMQGANPRTNPHPDPEHLTPANFVGIALPVGIAPE